MRNKVSREIKAEAARLYMEGLSLRVIAMRFHVAKESVRKWILKFEEAFARKKLARKKDREALLPDETKVKRNCKIAYVSTCLDLARRGVISIQCMRSISSLYTTNVTREALRSCREKPVVIVDHAQWYRYAFESLGLDWLQKTFGIRNYIERWYRTLKERTRRFYNNFPIRNEERAIDRISKIPSPVCLLVQSHAAHETFKCVLSVVK
ncbi:MAG: hypothetical protein ACYC7D_11135 [Nitrososphaerales archaeon]